MSVKIDEDSMSLENNGVETVAAFASTVASGIRCKSSGAVPASW
jgi:hypothetical protein